MHGSKREQRLLPTMTLANDLTLKAKLTLLEMI